MIYLGGKVSRAHSQLFFPRPRVGAPLMADVTGYGRRRGWIKYLIEDGNPQVAAQGSRSPLSPPLLVAFNVKHHSLM